ncbi:hypothetical protein HK096_001156 [Nowakowskiella sp. JEL0078]|nr:hypothetical protein HK096_001156 [Nowakowskiella sp. JEL0078]
MTAPTVKGERAMKMSGLIPLQRAASAIEIAEVAVFLGGSQSGYINGQAIPIDGGISATIPFVSMK